MKCTLTWHPELEKFRLQGTDEVDDYFTQSQLRESFEDSAATVINEWADYAKAHPNSACDFTACMITRHKQVEIRTLMWRPKLGVFCWRWPDGFEATVTEEKLRELLSGNAKLNQWADYAKAHPNIGVDYDCDRTALN